MTTTKLLYVWVIGAVFGVAGGYAMWHETAGTDGPGDDRAPAPASKPGPGTVELPAAAVRDLGITTASLRAGSASPTLRAPGRLQADPAFTAVVRAPLAGTLAAGERAFPRLGDVVRAGDVMVLLAPCLTAAETADLAQRRAAAAADEASAKVAVGAARADLARQRDLHAKDNTASQRAVDLAEVELATQMARLAAAQDTTASLTVGTAASIRLLSPIDGVVDEIGCTGGEHVDAGGRLFVIHAPGRVVARVEVAAGAPVAATFASASIELLMEPPRVLSARFLSWTPGAANDRALLLTITGDESALRVGLPIVAHVPRATEAVVGLLVPEAAIVRRSDGAYVFVHTQDRGGVSTFVRMPVAFDAPVDGGWLATERSGGPGVGAEVVVTGAGTLFSIEQQRAVDAQTGG